MNKDKLTKEALISVWNRVCKKENNKDRFSTSGSDESPYYLLTIDSKNNPTILCTISATLTGKEKKYDYKINVIFGEFVEYASFKLDESEFNSLADLFVKHQNEAINKEVNRIVEDTEERFLNLISDGKI